MKWVVGRLYDYADNEYEKVYEELSKSRKIRIDRLKLETDRKRSLLGEILLKKLLSEEGVEADVLSADNGKPYLSNESYYISISHSGEMAAAVISENPIGIDIEKVRVIDLKLIERVCTKEEAEYIKSADNPELQFLEIWTAKEAYFKKQGTGITNLKTIGIFDLKREFIKLDGYVLQIVY